MGRTVRVLATLIAGTVGSTVLFLLTAIPAYADKSIQATIGQNCGSGQVMTGGTFTLTQVNAGQQITVNTLQARTYAPSNFGSGTATYNVTLNAPLASPPAVATVPNSWAGSFSLTNAQCTAAKAPSISTSVSLCNAGPTTATIRLSNNNPVWTKYTVTLTGQSAKSVELTAGETDQVDFQPLTPGTTYSLNVSGSDGTTTPGSVAVASCQGPAPVPTTKGPGQPTKNLPQTPGSPPSATEVGLVSASPMASQSAVPADSEEFDNSSYDGDGGMLTYPTFWFGLLCVMLVVIGAAVFLIIRRRNQP